VADKSGIEWTDATWNPVRGCQVVSPGCANCYAAGIAARFSGPGQPYEGLAKRTKAGPVWTGKVALVQFDAHADADLNDAHMISDTQTLTRLMEQNLLRGSDVTLVGLRGRGADVATQKRLTDSGVRILSTAAVTERGWQAVTNDILSGLKKGPENIFVSFDMSVLDPGDAPASGRPVPGGISMREAIPMVRQLCAQTKVVGFDLLDAAPILDPTYVSRMSANYILHACLSGIAMRKTGMSVETAKR